MNKKVLCMFLSFVFVLSLCSPVLSSADSESGIDETGEYSDMVEPQISEIDIPSGIPADELSSEPEVGGEDILEVSQIELQTDFPELPDPSATEPVDSGSSPTDSDTDVSEEVVPEEVVSEDAFPTDADIDIDIEDPPSSEEQSLTEEVTEASDFPEEALPEADVSDSPESSPKDGISEADILLSESPEAEGVSPADDSEEEPFEAGVFVTFTSLQPLSVSVYKDAEAVLPYDEAAALSSTLTVDPEPAVGFEAEDSSVSSEVSETEVTPYAEASDTRSSSANVIAVYRLLPGEYTYSAAAPENTKLSSLDNVSFIVGEVDMEISVFLESLYPYGLPGMPAGYVFSESELADKRRLVDNDVLSALSSLTEGEDYEPGCVVFTAYSQEYASLVAEAFHADLIRYSYGVAKIALHDLSVREAVSLSTDMSLPFPAVSPNYCSQLSPVSGNGANAFAAFASLSDWAFWVKDVFQDPDPLILDPAAEDYQWQHDMLNTYEAWAVTMGSPAITVAVLDTGIGSSPDLDGKVTSLDIGLGTYDDNNLSHGTHVAGIIGARANNGFAGAGVAPNVSLLSVKVINKSGKYDDDYVISGIYEAVDAGANIINMSLGGLAYNFAFEDAIRYAILNNVTVIASMGNYSGNIRQYPAAYPGVIAVSAVNRTGNLASFSNYGSWAAVSAPGVEIFSTSAPGDVLPLSGTSQAAPMVAGVAALYMSRFGSVSPAVMKQVLQSSVTNGVIDAAKLFGKKYGIPSVSFVNKDGLEVSGSSLPADGFVVLSVEGMGQDDLASFIVTQDGKNPSVKDGTIVNGKMEFCDDNGSVKLSVAEYFHAAAGDAFTVKAAAYSGMGLLSGVRSVKVKVVPAEVRPRPTKVEVVAPPAVVAPGKSVALSAKVFPDDADQSVTWSIVSKSSNLPANILSSTGVLSAPLGLTGFVTVRATSAVPGCSGIYSKNVRINIKSLTPVYVVELSKKNATIVTGESFSLTPYFRDAKKNILTDVSYMFESSNPKVASVDASSGVITGVSSGTATVKCKALDGSGKTNTCKVTVKSALSAVSLSGQTSMAPGASATYKVVTTPSDAYAASVEWSLSDAPAGVSITNTGKVKVSSNVAPDTVFSLFATVSDGVHSFTESFSVTVRSKVKSVLIECDFITYPPADYKLSSGKLTSVTVYSTDAVQYTSGISNRLRLIGYTDLYENHELVWSSSNEKVAFVSNGYVFARSAGSAKITAKANDGSGKSASVTVKVINPVSSLSLTAKAPLIGENFNYIGFGKTAANIAALGDAYGKPGITKLRWEVAVGTSKSDPDPALTDTFVTKMKLISVSTSGVLSVKAGLRNHWYNIQPGDYYIFVTAHTTDGTSLSSRIIYQVNEVATKVQIKQWDGDEDDSNDIIVKSRTITITSMTMLRVESDAFYPSFTVRSSNPNVAGAVIDTYQGKSVVKIYPAGTKTGSATITVKAADGSNRSASVTIKVIKG